MNNIAIIGSGLAAISVAKVLVKRGLKPLILDYGKTISKEKNILIKKLKQTEYEKWSISDLNKLYKKDNFFQPIMDKTVFGSTYFYEKSNSKNNIINSSNIPFYSFAKGGLAEGWGGTILPADNADLIDWPLDKMDIKKYYRKALNDLPYLCVDDDLSKVFPLFSNKNKYFNQSKSTFIVLKKIKKIISNNNLIVGQSRLLTRLINDETYFKCQYCGRCISGCIFDSIYKPSQDLDKLIKNNSINYRKNIIVKKMSQMNNKIKIFFFDINRNKNDFIIFDKVFLAAGAIESTRIMVESNNLYPVHINLKTKSQIIFPLFTKTSLQTNWSNLNTQPDVFLEHKNLQKNQHWIHTQINTKNDLILNSLPFKNIQNKFLFYFKKMIMNHFFVAHTTIHSKYSGYYKLEFIKKNNKNILNINLNENIVSKEYLNLTQKNLYEIFNKASFYVLKSLVKKQTYSFHVGSSMPMTKKTFIT